MRDLRLIVFDVDGTLVDSQVQILDSMSLAFEAADLPMPSRAEALSVVGLSLPVALARLMPQVPEAERERMLDAYKTGFSTNRKKVPSPLYPGARQTLMGLAERPGVLLGVATGKSRRGLDRLLSEHDLGGFFVTTQVADDHPSKPDPSMLMAALRDTGVSAQSAVMIGDTTFDIEMGRAAGFRTIGVTWGYHQAEALVAAGADCLIADFAELSAALRGWA